MSNQVPITQNITVNIEPGSEALSAAPGHAEDYRKMAKAYRSVGTQWLAVASAFEYVADSLDELPQISDQNQQNS